VTQRERVPPAGPAGFRPGLRSIALAALKVALSAGLIWWAASQADLGAMAARIGQVSLPWLLPLLVLLALQAGLLCLRFRWVLAGAEGRVRPAWPVARTVLAGLLFNQPFPSTLGGDVARVLLLRRMEIPLGTALAAVVGDRGAALLAMLLTMALTLPLAFLPEIGLTASGLAILLWTDLGAGAGAAIVLVLFWRLRHLDAFARLHPVLERVAGLYATLRAALFAGRRLHAVLLLGIASHLMTALFGLCGAMALGIPLSLPAALLLIPPVLLIAQIPISVAGWGVREAAMVTALGFVGLPAEDALLVSVGIGLAVLFQGLAAGLAWSLTGGRRSALPQA